MADELPVPRSKSQIIGEMVAAFLSRVGLKGLRVGSPVLTMIEAAAQSDLRSSADIFTIEEAISLDDAEGDALDKIGNSEDIPRIQEARASTTVTISDTSFDKVQTKIYQGTAAPLAGSTTINVTSAAGITGGDSIYIGRGTSLYEGPIVVNTITPFTNYSTLNLATGTTRFHNLGESVIKAQGGDRVIQAGTVIQSAKNSQADSIQFKLNYNETVPDGENELTGVSVVALKPGTIGNVSAASITEFSSDPFNGASVSNALPVTNGLAREKDDDYRERIRSVRASRAKGTKLAIKLAALGVTAPDEAKRVLSATVLSRPGKASVLYIDDGSGYEEISEGVSVESITDAAIGGEDTFQTAWRPITKAFLETEGSAPFALVAGDKLAVDVSGVVTEHTFDTDEFRTIGAASAYEVVASINSNPDLLWRARTSNGGTKVVIYAKADENEDLQVQTPGIGTDANSILVFPSNRVYSISLYKNDRLLSKDGKLATVLSNSFDTWGALTGTETLILSIDGTPSQTISVTGQDFIDGNTGYGTVGLNSTAAWATVLTDLIAGATVEVSGSKLAITSNKGRNSRASIDITGGTLVTKGMFDSGIALGVTRDYVVDRNTGEIITNEMLGTDDRLTIGSLATRAFLESDELGTFNLASDTHLWFSLDGGAEMISHGLTSSTSIAITSTAYRNGLRVRFTASSAFQNVAVNDWIVIWDSGITGLYGRYRVAAVDGSGNWVEFEVDQLNAGRSAHQAAASYTNPNTIFLSGGVTGTVTAVSNSVESYDLTTGLATRLPPMSVNRCWHTATGLTNGNLLVVGGWTDILQAATGASEEFDGVSWSNQTTLPGGATLAGHTATLLNNGNVLIVGGLNGITYSNATYIYDTTTHTFSTGPTLTTRRAFHTATKRNDGTVLIAGGETTGGVPTATAELVDAIGASVSPAGSMSVARHGASAVLLASGDVLVMGGCTTAFQFGTYTGTLSTATSEYSSSTTWTAKTAMTNGRAYGTARMLSGNSNKVSFLFGRHNGTKMGETFDPGGNSWADVSAPGAAFTAAIGSSSHIACQGAGNTTSIWAFGGETTSTYHPQANVLKYTASTDTWAVPAEWDGTATLVNSGVAFVRSSDQTHQVVVPSGSYTASTLVGQLGFPGATAATYKTSKARVSTNTFDHTEGSIGLITADTLGQGLGIPTGIEDNLVGHVASVETVNSMIGTPDFNNHILTDMVYNDKAIVQNIGNTWLPAAPYYYPNFSYVASKPLTQIATAEQVGLPGDTAFVGRLDAESSQGSIALDFNNGGVNVFESSARPYDRVWFANSYTLSGTDTLSIDIDGDASKKYSFNTYRKLKPLDTPYGSTNKYVDADNGDSSLLDTLGIDYGFKDHALFMKARVQTHLQGDSTHYLTPPADMTKAILWRYYRFGPEGNTNQLRYTYPTAANQDITVTTQSEDVYEWINIVLGSGAARSSLPMADTNKIGYTHQGAGVATVFFGFKSATAQRTAGTVRITVDATFMTNTGITDINLGTGGTLIYVVNNNPSYPDGYYTTTGGGVNYIEYAEGAGNLGPTAITGSLTYGPTSGSLAGLGIIAGDYVNFGSGTALPSGFTLSTMLISAYDDDLAFEGYIDEGLGTVDGSVHWVELTDRSSINFFASNNDTASTIVTAVNALVPATISGTLLGDGSGNINASSAAEGGFVNGFFLLQDGVNFVYSYDENAGDIRLTTKMTPATGLATDSDWLNEEVRLVPVTALNVVDMLNSLAMTGLSSQATIQLSDKAQKVQIASQNAGSSGSVQVQSGTANGATASVISSPISSDAARLLVKIATANADGFVGGAWVDIDNSSPNLRNVIDTATTLTSITAAGVFTLNSLGTPIWSLAGTSVATTSNLIQIEKQGDFVCLQDTGLGTALNITGVEEGDWIRIVDPSTPIYTTAISSANVGVFRVVRIDSTTKAVWIENASAVIQAQAECDIKFLEMESMQVGDTIRISGGIWGTANNGVWTITSVGDAGSGEYTDQFTFAVDVSTNPLAATGAVGGLGGYSSYVAVNEGSPGRYLKQIYTIKPDTDDATQTIIVFNSIQGYNKIGASVGSVLTMRDKLAFPYGLSVGIDGYRHSTGLIGELNKVIEGDPEDPATYPGYKAEGARINIEGAPIRRLQFSILIRGINSTVVKNKIRSAVASVVNSKGVGESIGFSEIVGAIERIQGVSTATIISPTYDAGHDQVQVQPYERPFILDLQNDIALSFFGE